MGKNIDIAKNDVILNISQNIFADIILNFLGNKQVLLYEDENYFHITLNDLEQFYYLINEKIHKENYTNIDYFSVLISYHDKTKREINGIESLKSYLETRDVSPKNIILTWNIILDFPSTQTIENQKIEVFFNTEETNNNILLKIEHTNQAWGIEILNLLKDHIQTLVIDTPKKLKIANSIRKTMYKNTFLTLLTLLLVMTTYTLFLIDTIESKKDIRGKSISKIINIGIKENKSQEALLASFLVSNNVDNNLSLNSFSSQKINNELVDFFEIQKNNKPIFLNKKNSVIFFIIGIILGIAIFTEQIIRYYKTSSFILITKRAEKELQNFIESKNKIEYFSLTLIAVSIICSVIANIIYQFFFI